MRIKRTLPALALGLLLVAGCGQTTPEESTAPLPSLEAETTTPSVQTPEETTPDAQPSAEPEPAETATPAATQSEPAETSASPSESEPAATGQWTTMEVQVVTPEDATNLVDLPESFRAFVAQSVGTPDAGGCQSELTITGYHPDGYVTGADFAPGCGGSNIIWGESGDAWGVLLSMQALLDCAEFENNDIPKGHPELECLDESGAQVDW